MSICCVASILPWLNVVWLILQLGYSSHHWFVEDAIGWTRLWHDIGQQVKENFGRVGVFHLLRRRSATCRFYVFQKEARQARILTCQILFLILNANDSWKFIWKKTKKQRDELDTETALTTSRTRLWPQSLLISIVIGCRPYCIFQVFRPEFQNWCVS